MAVVGAALLGSAKTGRSDVRAHRVQMVLPPVHNEHHDQGPGGPAGPLEFSGPPLAVVTTDVGHIPLPTVLPAGTIGSTFSPILPAGAAGTNVPLGGSGLWSEQPAEVLSGPLPVYPELLRQAGVQGKVVLEAIVDTTGRVVATSIQVVSATNPAFVAGARQALLAALFRPAIVAGKPIQMRVRIPYEFTIRNGIGRAR
ncbi:MAG TPA: energy transducer TonB [Gemmatimonadales bacterium]|nr:energy transducer TonB [Gemmatimonadales bacterium]